MMNHLARKCWWRWMLLATCGDQNHSQYYWCHLVILGNSYIALESYVELDRNHCEVRTAVSPLAMFCAVCQQKLLLYCVKTTVCIEHIFNLLACEIWNPPTEWYKSPKHHFCLHHYAICQVASEFIFNVMLDCCCCWFRRRRISSYWVGRWWWANHVARSKTQSKQS